MKPILTGWRKDPRDSRDRLVRLIPDLPELFDLSDRAPSVWNQLNLGSCVGHGKGAACTGIAIAQRVFTERFSPSWIYTGARSLEGTLDEDQGCYPRDAAKWIKRNGLLLEHFRPYTGKLETADPLTWLHDGKPVAEEALKWQIESYSRADNGVDGICSALAAGHLVAIGTPWPDRWMETDKIGRLPGIRRQDCRRAGGHCTFLLAYNRKLRMFLLQNSWGEDWGIMGRAWIPFEAFEVFKAAGRGYDAYYFEAQWGQA